MRSFILALLQIKPGLTCAEVAERLGVSLKTVWRLIESDKLDALKAGAKLYFVPEQSLVRYRERGDKQ